MDIGAAELLVMPAFDLAASDTVNYGAIGVVIGYAAGPWLERQQKLREADLEVSKP